MQIVANITCLHVSHVETTQDILKVSQGYPVLTLGDNYPSRNRDIAQNVIVQCCDLERSRLSIKVTNVSIRSPPSTHKYICEASLRSYCQFCVYGRAIADRKAASE